MAVSTTTTLSIGCNMFAGRLRQWEPYESKLFRKPINYFRWFCLNDHDLQRFRTETLNFNSRRVLLHSLHAYGQEADDAFLPNVSEDTDEMFDDLLKKYGKVVFRKNDRKSQSSELDDDAESLSYMTCWYEKKTSTCKDAVLAILFYLPRLRCECWKWVPDLTVVAVEMAKVASDVKAADIRVLFVKPLVYWTRFFIIATAFSRPQIDAIRSRIRDLAEKKYRKIPSGDTKPNSWTLLDFGDVVIHIFLPQQRAFYNLEEFYGNATLIELPSENQPPFRS